MDWCYLAYLYTHQRACKEGRATDVGYVVGLTNASEEVLDRIVDSPLLIPGLGAQGGDLASLRGRNRTAPDVVNVSRGITYKDMDQSFAQKAKAWGEQLAV